MSTEACRHMLEQPENAEWPEPVYWDHYCNCLDDAKRREILTKAREWAGKGSECHLHDHKAQLEAQVTVLGEVGVALAQATEILEKHHRFLDGRMISSRGDGLTTALKAFTLAHDNLVGLMDKALKEYDGG